MWTVFGTITFDTDSYESSLLIEEASFNSKEEAENFLEKLMKGLSEYNPDSSNVDIEKDDSLLVEAARECGWYDE